MDAEAYGIDIVVDIDSEIPMVSVDKDKLNQVLLNLLLNSIQAMPGGGMLRVKVRNIRGEKISVAISDNGQGIEPENLTRVFDPYFTTKPNGTGLGLAMSAKIVEEHGGEIVLSSQPGECTTAEVILPVEQV